jgi:MFS superfamily sulfate permease-like transporter
LRDAIAAAESSTPVSSGDTEAILTPDFAVQQSDITAGLQNVAARIGANTSALADEAATRAAALAAVEDSQKALATLEKPSVEADENSQRAAVQDLEALLAQLKNHQWAAKIGILTICVLLAWQAFVPRRLKAIPGPLVAVLIAAIVAFWGCLPVLYVEAPDSLLAAIHLPSFSVWTTDNTTWLVESILVMALIASAETLLCATAVDRMQGGQRTNYDRELIAQGVGNSICGFIGALPMTGVIVRSAANVQAGARTRKSAMLHGLWLLVFVCLLTPVLRTIPVACLAAVLVYTGYKLVNWKHLVELRKYGWGEVLIYLVTLVTIVATDLLTGVVVGIGLSAAKLLLTFAHLQTELTTEPLAKRVQLKLSGAATFLRLPRLAAALERVPADAELHVDLEHLHYVDHACLELLTNWAKQHEAAGGALVVDWDSLHAQFRDDAAPVRRRAVA